MPLPFNKAKEAMARTMEKGKAYLNPETAENITALVNINRAGLITFDSQEGLKYGSVIEEQSELRRYAEEPDVNSEERTIRLEQLKAHRARIGHHYKSTERAYLCGFMKRDQGNAFIDWMNGNTDKLAYITVVTDADAPDYKIGVTYEGTAPAKKDIVFNRFFTSLPLIIRQIDFDNYKTVNAGITDDSDTLVWVNLADLVHGRRAQSSRGLFTDVLRGLAALNQPTRRTTQRITRKRSKVL
jgi:hypothetical protein